MTKKTLLLIALSMGFAGSAQTLVQSVNSGSIIGTNSSVSVGEIVVVPTNPNASNSGIIGILAQLNSGTLEVPELELAANITVYPNPTVARIFFESRENLANQKISVYNNSGQLVSKKQLDASQSLDLSELSNGIYLIQFSDKKLQSFKIIKH